jgi:multidrug efflux pump subunit AcrA (membrane-fusion protein)
MRIKGEIEIERARQVVTVPLDALFVSPEGPIVYSASRKPIRVTVGRRNATKAEILSGLDEGVTILRPAAAAKKDTA